MENSVGKHESSDISRRSRSLDLRRFYEEKSRVFVGRARAGNGDLSRSVETRALKRRHWSSVENKRIVIGQSNRGSSTRKEISLSSLEPVTKRSLKGSNVSGSTLDGFFSGFGKPQGPSVSSIVSRNLSSLSDNSGKFGNDFVLLPKKKKGKSVPSDGNHQNSSGLGGNIIIPKRPRGISTRKKSEGLVNSRRETDVSASSSKSSAIFSKLCSDLTTSAQVPLVKRKKRFDEFKENGSDRYNSVLSFKSADGSAVQVARKNVRRNCKKRLDSSMEKQSNAESESLLVVDSAKFSAHFAEDDEENLEQNAARMLSSRFDPRCTGFSRSRTSSSLKEINGSPVLFQTLHGDSKGLETSFIDAASRVLRPRKQNYKNFVRKRRHFYEVCSRGMDPYWVLKQRIKVFWPLDQSWYFGFVKDYSPVTKLHHIKYDDRDEEWVNLQNERIKLLLFPSELTGKFDTGKSRLEVEHKNEEGDENSMDDNCVGYFMESEPIISWLARSTHRVKSSPQSIMKDKNRSHVHKKFSPPLLLAAKETLSAYPSNMNSDILSTCCVTPERLVDEMISVVPGVKSKTCSSARKLSFVYFRRRFRMKREGSSKTLDEGFACRSLTGSDGFHTVVANRVEPLEKLNFPFTAMKLKQGMFSVSLPLQRVLDLAFLAENIWPCNSLLFLRYGTLILLWPNVCMEIVFVDNGVGLRLLSFEGCLMHAVALLCLIIRTFHWPNDNKKLGELPFTSIGFKLSVLRGKGRQLSFAMYNFLELESSKWAYLNRKLEQHHVTMRELHISDCTYANLKSLLSRSDQMPFCSIHEKLTSPEAFQKRSRQGIMHQLIMERSATSNMSYSKFDFNKNRGIFSIAAAPNFFLSLHLKVLMENNVASISFQKTSARSLGDCPEKCGKLIPDISSPVEDSSDQVSEITLENLGSLLNPAPAGSGLLSYSNSKEETDALSISNDGDWMRPFQNSLNSELNVTGNSVGYIDMGKTKNDGTIVQLQRLPSYSGSWRGVGKPYSVVIEDISSPDKSEGGSASFLNTSNGQTQSFSQVESQKYDGETRAPQQSASDFSWNMKDRTIRSPKPTTAPRSMWHCRRHNPVSPSFGHFSKLWPEDFIQDGFVNSSKKPRTQVSYSLPFGGYFLGSKSRRHHKKGRPYKKIKSDTAKRMSAGSGSSWNYHDSLTCDANVLVTVGDRGWRECGAKIVLESDVQKDWRILVKHSGATWYAFKAHQFLQPGISNRYTHAMMWKGGKDWTLEFTDRNQWNLFKVMYEECYNQNIRAASFKNIPIPGVCQIEDNDDYTVEVPFVSSSPKYFRQVGTEVDMALDPSRVLYDMDSDDEKWISISINFLDSNGTKLPEISEEMFEKAMDMFEKVAYDQTCDEFTDAELDSYMAEVGPLHVIKAIHEHWRQKRQKKGMPLIRQFQPALWEWYQQQLKEWELAMSRMHNSSNGCQEKAFLLEKPPMFAFCLRPRGLEVPNKCSKQRSHRKFTVAGQHNAFIRELDGLQAYGRKMNGLSVGEERALVTAPYHESSDDSLWFQSATRFSPREAANAAFLTMDDCGSERNQHLKLHRNSSKKMRLFSSPRDSQMMSMSCNQRTKGNGVFRWNTGSEWSIIKQSQSDGFQKHKADIDEFRLRDASSAGQHASNMAKLKREKAQRLLHKADLALHKAVVAVMTAEAIKASENDLIDDG